MSLSAKYELVPGGRFFLIVESHYFHAIVVSFSTKQEMAYFTLKEQKKKVLKIITHHFYSSLKVSEASQIQSERKTTRETARES